MLSTSQQVLIIVTNEDPLVSMHKEYLKGGRDAHSFLVEQAKTLPLPFLTKEGS